jgi:hypothetical protein
LNDKDKVVSLALVDKADEIPEPEDVAAKTPAE